jgi:aspartokinase
MATISLLVQEHVAARPLLQEALIEGIVNYASLAEKLQPMIETRLQKRVKLSAVVMALRRHSENLKEFGLRHEEVPYEIIIRTSLCDLVLVKTPGLVETLKHVDSIIKYERGDSMNVIHGNYETSVIVPEKYKPEILKRLTGEKIIATRDGLVALGLTFKGRFYDTPGVVAKLTRALAWANVNIIEIVSTYTELTFIIDKNDLTTAYEVLK